MGDRYDIAIIGAGPAGANAAIAASAAGARVVVLDEQPKAGGQVWRAKSAAILTAPDTPESSAGNDLRHALDGCEATHLADARVWQIEREGVPTHSEYYFELKSPKIVVGKERKVKKKGDAKRK